MKLLYPLAKRFIAGYDFESARPAIDELLSNGFDVTIDYVGEMSTTIEDVQQAVKQYTKILDSYSNIDISIKPSQLGLLIDSPNAKNLCRAALNQLAVHAHCTNNTIRLDMEDSRVTEDTIELSIENNVGCALQANHPKTMTNLWKLIDHDISIRLVKGAYKEQVTDIDEIRKRFMIYADTVGDIAIATHDEILLNQLSSHTKFEFLYGVRRDLQEKLKSEGKEVRIYVPYGDQWLPYTLRRLKEWKNLKFIIVNMFREYT